MLFLLLFLQLVAPSSFQTNPLKETDNIQTLSAWQWNNDPATKGSSSGSSLLSGSTRQFNISFQSSGGEIFHTTFGSDTTSMHFLYDAWLNFTNVSVIANVEMDMNQVLSNGETVIYGVQCDGYTDTWDYTVNTGTPSKPVDTWVHSNLACNPRTWSINAWHHVQLAYNRDSVGNVTYQYIIFDGKQQFFTKASGNSAFALGWSSVLLTNFQIDGLGTSGSTTAFMSSLTIYRW